MAGNPNWKPGKSGNPSGRPKEFPEIRDLAREHGPAAIAKLVEFLHGDDQKLAKAAADSLLDRGFGKPSQSVDTTIANPDGTNITGIVVNPIQPA